MTTITPWRLRLSRSERETVEEANHIRRRLDTHPRLTGAGYVAREPNAGEQRVLDAAEAIQRRHRVDESREQYAQHDWDAFLASRAAERKRPASARTARAPRPDPVRTIETQFGHGLNRRRVQWAPGVRERASAIAKTGRIPRVIRTAGNGAGRFDLVTILEVK